MSNTELVQKVAQDLIDISYGQLLFCPGCGQSEDGIIWDDDRKEYHCSECGEEAIMMSYLDYFRDASEIKYNADAEYEDVIASVKIYMTVNGLTVCVDTEDCKVKLGDSGVCGFPRGVADKINKEYEYVWIYGE